MLEVISNLNFISKILEKVVASRIQSHLLSNSLSSSFQSAYHMFHSTETTLLSIHNDLILALDRGEVTSLILLDLSAAVDTVDHSILLHRLQHWFGLHGISLDWFSSYLTSRSQAVSIQNSTSSFSNLSCGSRFLPWPTSVYSLYHPSVSVISRNSTKYHLSDDDTQLYISFTPSNSTSSLEILGLQKRHASLLRSETARFFPFSSLEKGLLAGSLLGQRNKRRRACLPHCAT